MKYHNCQITTQALIKAETRGSQESVIAHLVFNLTSQVNRK
jgi:hypothetical protein